MTNTLNFLLAGVGGQGTILASDVLVNVGLAAGYQAKQAEVHGMSQRGGSVTSFVRWGKVVYSPLVGAGEVDVYLAFEKAEALRNLGQLRRGALGGDQPAGDQAGHGDLGRPAYPDDDRLRMKIAEVTERAVYVDGEQIAAELGNARAANVVLLGALSALIERAGLAPELTSEAWLNVIVERVPARYVELNKRVPGRARGGIEGTARSHLRPN